jgi:hypothetical protein
LTLTFGGLAQQIVAADITAHFYPANVRAIPAAPSAANKAPLTETFHLSSTSGSMRHFSIWAERTAPQAGWS